MEYERLSPPSTRPIARRVYALPVERIDPVIRIAHRITSPLVIPQRIIFDHELVLVVTGLGTLRTADGDVSFAPGTILFIRPFLTHQFLSSDDRFDHVAVHFDFRDGMPPAGRGEPAERKPYEVRPSGGLTIPLVTRCRPTDAAYAALIALGAATRDASPTAAMERRGCLLRAIAALLTRSDVPATSPVIAATEAQRNAARIDRAVRHVDDHFTDPLDADRLAEIAGLSPSHFTRLFRAHTGYTPMVYLRRRRIEAARRLLADVDLSVKEIALRCGFDDPYHFSRVFHQIDGLPPTAYREAVLAGRRS